MKTGEEKCFVHAEVGLAEIRAKVLAATVAGRSSEIGSSGTIYVLVADANKVTGSLPPVRTQNSSYW